MTSKTIFDIITLSDERRKMDFVIIVLGILYLCGVSVGKALAICSIIEGVLIITLSIIRMRRGTY